MKNTKCVMLALVLGLSACADREYDTKPKYEQKSQIPVNVSSITVVQEFDAFDRSNKSDELCSKSLVQGVEKWAKKRLMPIADFGVARVTISEASIARSPNVDFPEKLHGKLAAKVTLLNANGSVISYMAAKTGQSISVGGLSPVEVDRRQKKLETDLIDALDAEIEKDAYTKMRSLANVGKVVR